MSNISNASWTADDLKRIKAKMTLFTMVKGEGDAVFTFDDFYAIDELLEKEIMKRKHTNQCLFCVWGCMAECPVNPDVVFGEGVGNDNVIACHNYVNKEAYDKYQNRKQNSDSIPIQDIESVGYYIHNNHESKNRWEAIQAWNRICTAIDGQIKRSAE